MSPMSICMYVLDEWYEHQVKSRPKGPIRYADDFVIGCEDQADTQRLREVLPKRFARYGLTIHAQKTRLVSFKPPPRAIHLRAPPPGD